ncbi:MAG: GMC oxidoreductase [Inquilinus sp.]|uniref:GMC oxidoreductase n=1 Tax=Inquilinus sp. TaxID=1932117 RepID=UPI003F34A431
MPGGLPQLVETAGTVDVQRTTLSIDALGRYICSTWAEATQNGGRPFDAVVVGSGMYGAYCAEKIWRFGAAKGLRVLVLEAGPFLISEHVQNIADIGLNVPSALDPAQDPGVPRELVWGIAWRGNVAFPGLAYCVGGKSLYWGGWCPRLTAADLQQWPAATAAALQAQYPIVESETGVVPTTDFISGELFDELTRAFAAQTGAVAHVDTNGGTNGIHEAPLAVQGAQPASGLFSFDKFSSATLLAQAVREDVGAAGAQDRLRRLFLVPRAHVLRLAVTNGTVTGLDVAVAGRREFLPLNPACSVVLAASAIETTRLALVSFPRPPMGGNLMAHMRTDMTVRIRRTAFHPLPPDLETAALLIRGGTQQGRFHIQVTGSASRALSSDGLLFRMVPDLDLLGGLLANDDPDWIAITLRGIAEMTGDRSAPNRIPSRSWIDLSPAENDEFGVPRAWVNLAVQPGEIALWGDMDHAMLDLCQRVAGSPANIEYLYDGGWQAVPYPLDRPFPPWHQGLGETYHEAGTLWMGDNPATSVTDPHGRFHHVANAYSCDQAAFPTVGSVNPVLTGLALAREMAEHITGLH